MSLHDVLDYIAERVERAAKISAEQDAAEAKWKSDNPGESTVRIIHIGGMTFEEAVGQ